MQTKEPAMKTLPRLLPFFSLILFLACTCLAEQSLTQNGITWTFAADHKTGTYCNGEYWVIGPVKIVSITNSLNASGFEVPRGRNGSMINPDPSRPIGLKQGFTSNLANYNESLNAALPGGNPISAENPLLLSPNQTLISAVSWLYRSKDDLEPGSPPIQTFPTPRPAIRTAALLTCISEPPAPGSFRPPYCGSDKTAKFKKSDMNLSALKNLDPVEQLPSVEEMEKAMSHTWVDYVWGWEGGFTHPSEHMPNYGRDMAYIVGKIGLMLNLDLSKTAGSPSKETLAINMVQFGIDLTGIADANGGWLADGGHGLGRKLPILLAGVLLNDPHMKDVGQWKTRFQENEQTFYVTQETVDLSHSSQWAPDKRVPHLPYDAEHIGMPEWGIRHFERPAADNREWTTVYRDINGSAFPMFALAAHIMGLKKEWNNDAFFDYCDRYMSITEGGQKYSVNKMPSFGKAMWGRYRADYEKTKWMEPGQPYPHVEK
jgi:hypothetical protein